MWKDIDQLLSYQSWLLLLEVEGCELGLNPLNQSQRYILSSLFFSLTSSNRDLVLAIITWTGIDCWCISSTQTVSKCSIFPIPEGQCRVNFEAVIDDRLLTAQYHFAFLKVVRRGKHIELTLELLVQLSLFASISTFFQLLYT